MVFSPKSILPIKYSKTVQLHTDLKINECRDRLGRSLFKPTLAVLFGVGSRLVVGEIDGDNFWVRRNFTRNSWRVTLDGNLISDAKGTRINGQFRMARWVEPFMSCMVISFLIFALFILVVSFYDLFWGRFRGNWIGGL